MLIYTTLGDMDDSLLDRTEGVISNEREHTTWVEYRLKGQPDSPFIHRSVHVHLGPASTLPREYQTSKE